MLIVEEIEPVTEQEQIASDLNEIAKIAQTGTMQDMVVEYISDKVFDERANVLAYLHENRESDLRLLIDGIANGAHNRR